MTAQPREQEANRRRPIWALNYAPQATAVTTSSSSGLGLDRVEVAYGVAEVLPLLVEDHVEARTGGLLAFGIVRVLARRGQHLRWDCCEEVAHHRDATRPDL